MKASWKRATSLLLVALMTWWCLSTTHAGKILTFVCSAYTRTDPDTGEKTPCAFETQSGIWRRQTFQNLDRVLLVVFKIRLSPLDTGGD